MSCCLVARRDEKGDFVNVLCTSRISHVAVYARGAVVTRQVDVPSTQELADGDVELVIPDVTVRSEPGSFRAQLPACGRTITSIGSELVPPASGPLVETDGRKLDALSHKIQRARSEIERLATEQRQLQSQFPDPALRTTSFSEKVEDRMADAIATVGLFSEVQAELAKQQLAQEETLAELLEQKTALELAKNQSSTAQRPGSGQPTRSVRVFLSGTGPVSELVVSYVVSAARFFPAYALRLKDGGKRAVWSIEAHVAQLGGEDWQGVRLALSTADLIYDARLPELPSLRFGRAQPPAKRGYRPPPDGLDRLFAGYDRGFAKTDEGAALGGKPKTGARPKKAPTDVDDSLSDEPTWATKAEFVEEELAKKGRADTSGADGFVGGMPPPQEVYFASGDLPARTEAAKPLSREQLRSFSAGAPPPAPPMTLSAAPGSPAAPMRKSKSAMPRGGGGGPFDEGSGAVFGSDGLGSEPQAPESKTELEPQDSWLDFDNLQLANPDDARTRGKLARRSDDLAAKHIRRATRAMEQLETPSGLTDPLTSRGQFDHRYEAEGLLDIASDGKLHRVAILSAEGPPMLRLVTVPRERAEVYREVELQNPCGVPLLSGPVDVFVEGALLTTDAIQRVDRGGSLRIGMGVEDRVRVARNVRAEEESAGLLGGSTAMTHTVTLEIQSALGQPAQLEVFDRWPTTEDKNVTLELVYEKPPHTPYDQADRGAPIRKGMKWRLSLPPGGKANIEYQYRIVFSAKSELVGGNRRD